MTLPKVQQPLSQEGSPSGTVYQKMDATASRAKTLVRMLVAVLVGHGVVLSGSARSQPAIESQPDTPKLRRHHLGVQLGLFNHFTDFIDLGSFKIDTDDYTGLANLSYRYSISPVMDVDFELRHWIGLWPTPQPDKVKIAGGFIGPGIRFHGADRTTGSRAIPYVQGNVYYVQEQVSHLKETRYEHGIGFGLSGGVDLYLSRLISIPVEVSYVDNVGGARLDDLSGVAVTLGVNVNF